MDYQVWTKDEYEGWSKVDCGDKEAATREIDKAVRLGRDPLLTISVPYNLSIKLEEEKAGQGLKPKSEKEKPGEIKNEESKSEAD